MAKSVYLDKGVQPDEPMVAATAGKSKEQWDEAIRHASEAYPAFSWEWKYYGKAWGWSLVIKSKAKTLCYLTPADGYFQVSIIFNNKGRALAAGIGLPEKIAQAVDASKNNAKNIPYDFKVRTAADLDIAKQLLEVRSKT